MTLVDAFVIIADNNEMDKIFIKKVGNRIKTLRKQNNLTQEELGFKANVSRSTVGMIESAKNDITLTKIKYLAKALGVEPYELLKFN